MRIYNKFGPFQYKFSDFQFRPLRIINGYKDIEYNNEWVGEGQFAETFDYLHGIGIQVDVYGNTRYN